MKKHKKFTQGILLPAVVVLLVLQFITLPFVVCYTFADKADFPAGVLTYTTGKLQWDVKTDSQGIAEIDIFNPRYQSVKTENGDKTIAPGTENSIYARLINNSQGEITYTAVLFELKTSEEIAVYSKFNVQNSVATESFSLPEHVDYENVISAVTGRVTKGSKADFEINWLWEFEIDDTVDTKLGNKQNLDDYTLGLYIVVEDDNEVYLPQTGDNGIITVYLIIFALSIILITVLLAEKIAIKIVNNKKAKCINE